MQPEPYPGRRGRGVEAQLQAVTIARRAAERLEGPARQAICLRQVGDVPAPAGGDQAAVGRLVRALLQPGRREVGRLGGGEPDLRRVVGDQAPGREPDGRGKRREAQRHNGAGHRGRVRLDAEMPEEGTPSGRRQPVQPVHDELAHPGEQLQQRDARVARVVVGPARGRPRQVRAQFGDQVRPGTVVELRQRYRHGHTSSASLMTCRPEAARFPGGITTVLPSTAPPTPSCSAEAWSIPGRTRPAGQPGRRTRAGRNPSRCRPGRR